MRDARLIAAVAIVIAGSTGYVWRNYDAAFPQASLTLPLSSQQITARATEFLNQRGLSPAGFRNLTLFDPDEHGDPSGWWHWIVYDLPATTTNLPKGAGVEHSTVLPSGTLQGRTDLGNDAYHGPCPDKGDPPHRYTFTIYALSVDKLDVPADSSGAMVVSTAKDHLLGKAVFVAHYGR